MRVEPLDHLRAVRIAEAREEEVRDDQIERAVVRGDRLLGAVKKLHAREPVRIAAADQLTRLLQHALRQLHVHDALHIGACKELQQKPAGASTDDERIVDAAHVRHVR
jgi:hypothetical protein